MPESIGNTLKQARRRLGLRVKDVAARTSARISNSYLSCIENDLRLPSEELILELADLLSLDRRELYLRLVHTRAPIAVRDALFAARSAPDPRFQSIRRLTVDELVDRVAEGAEARRELKELRRELARRDRCAPGAEAALSAGDRWSRDAARYRMCIEKIQVDAAISLDGDATITRHVIGLEPRPDRPALVAVQHTARVAAEGEASDDGFKLLESPADVTVELERRRLGPEQTLLRLLFPDGLRFEAGKDRRVSYVFRSLLKGAFSLERRPPERGLDALPERDGDRSSVVVAVDKPCERLDIDVRFPRFYVPEGVAPWAGTQDFYETEDNFIDLGVAESWTFDVKGDWRASLQVVRPQVGMKFAIAWMPLYREEFVKVKERLELEPEESAG